MLDRFNKLGVPVQITREEDIDLTPEDRPAKILSEFGNGSDVIVISNHINAAGGESTMW